MSNIIPVITLYQPWASFVILGWKTIETRLHKRFKSLEGKTIGIHAGKTYGSNEMCFKYLSPEQNEIAKEGKFPCGVFLGTVHVDSFGKLDDSHSQNSLIDCGNYERFGLFLSQIKEYPNKYVTGSMGIWYFDLDAMMKVKKTKAQLSLY